MTEQSKPTQSIKCTQCVFCDIAVNEGDEYSFLGPWGDEVTRVHEATVYVCRFWPPIAGQWPQVSDDDWCGQYEGKA